MTKLTEKLKENQKIIARYKELIEELEKTPYVVECNESSSNIDSFGEGVQLYDGVKIKSAYNNDGIS